MIICRCDGCGRESPMRIGQMLGVDEEGVRMKSSEIPQGWLASGKRDGEYHACSMQCAKKIDHIFGHETRLCDGATFSDERPE